MGELGIEGKKRTCVTIRITKRGGKQEKESGKESEIMATNDFSNTAFWVSPNATVTEVKGIPNFFSKSMFGKTSELKTAAQIVVVSALVAVILRIFSRRRLKTRVWWDDVCTMAAVFFLVTNQTVFSMIDFLGM